MNGSIYILLIIRDSVYCTVLRNRKGGGFHGFLHSFVIKCDRFSPLTWTYRLIDFLFWKPVYEWDQGKKWQRWRADERAKRTTKGKHEAAEISQHLRRRRRSEPGEQHKGWTGGDKQEKRSWRRSCQRAGRECLQEEAAGAAEKIQWRGEMERRADGAPALSEQRNFLKSWQRSTKSLPTERRSRGCGQRDRSLEKTMMRYVRQQWEERAQQWNQLEEKMKSKQSRPTSRRSSISKKRPLNLSITMMTRKRKSSCSPYLRSENPPSIHLLNPVLNPSTLLN